MLTLSGYQISEQIYESANSLIYRARRETENAPPTEAASQLAAEPVILKLLKGDYPSPERVAWFKREYEITRNLGPVIGSGVVKVYDLTYLQQRWVMVFEDFGGSSLSLLSVAGQLDMADFLRLAIDITAILGRLHQHQIIHKDLNPSNIVVVPPSGRDERGGWQVKIIDFGISTVLSRENPTFRNPQVLEGTLAYISPEQTGRMNRAIDYRTDFYSLGVTFYELLTGQLPFASDDPLELVHSHIAKQPRPLFDLNPDIPPILSDIVLKLMAKNAEDRYQSAHGLKYDLEQCLSNLTGFQNLSDFSLELGQQDRSDRLQIPQKLYGREREVELLLAGFERITTSSQSPATRGGSEGGGELALVAGQAGIGKSALVQEVYRPLTRRRGFFISGKFDQLQRNIPYSALAQAFRELIRHILTESEAEIVTWREKFLAALKSNGQVIIDLIPEVALIIGPQPPVPELAPTEAQNRFQLVFQNFVKLFAQPEHPLVIFIDDLQWADRGSLKLLEVLLTTFDLGHLYLIAAYRDNEVDEAHPLHLTVKHIQEARVNITRISLGPLTQPDVSRLIADTLHRPTEQVEPLAQLVFEKTGGNPFFTLEFSKALYDDGLLYFAPPPSFPPLGSPPFIPPTGGEGAGWRWDLAQIEARAMTNNVVELLVAKIKRLPPETQSVLQLAACIGNQFDLQTLAIVAKKPLQATATELSQALKEGLILPLGDTYKYVSIIDQPEQFEAKYKFAHDRIQQAGYSLIPQSDRQTVHWQIGQLLLARISPEQMEERLFNIVNHLNLGMALIVEDPRQRAEGPLQRVAGTSPKGEALTGRQLAELNLRAGERAIAATAYGSAQSYLRAGLTLLNEDSWQQHYDLTLRLYIRAFQAAYLNGDFEPMRRYSEIVLQHAQTPVDKAGVYEIEIDFYISQSQLRQAVQTALQALSLLGVTIPAQPDRTDVQRGLQAVQTVLDGLGHTRATQLERLLNLPRVTDATKLATLNILTKASLSSYYRDPNLMALTTLEAVKLAMQDGHSSTTPISFSFFAILLCVQLGDIETGYQFAQLTLKLQDRYGAPASRARVLINTSLVKVWREHIRHTLPELFETHQVALETGDLMYASIAGQIYCVRSLFVGKSLADLEQDMATYGSFMQQHKQTHNLYYHRVFWQLVLNLRGQAPIPWQLKGEQVEEEMRLQMLEAGFLIAVATLHLCQLMLSYLFQQWPQAFEQATAAAEYYDTTSTTIDDVLFYFYDSLARLAIHADVSEAEQQLILEKVSDNQQKMKFWAEHAPMNFLHKYLLVEAELARVLGQAGQAREYYDQAIELAQENGYINEEALAYEVAARFYLAKGKSRIAHLYLRDAHYAYQQWGAVAKVEDLESRYPEVFAPTEPNILSKMPSGVSKMPSGVHPTLTTPALTQRPASHLDLNSVLKASQVLSGEIVLDRLLTTLMKLLIENAGAQIGYLILQKDDGWWIEASGAVEQGEVAVLQSIPLTIAAYGRTPILSGAIINYVARTQENVVLNDATRKGQFVQDPYIVAKGPKSVLCTPLLHQGKLTSILYLENNLTSGAFTPDRLEILNLLSSQAAISVENARLYADLQSSELKYRTVFEDSKDVIYITTPTGQIADINQAGLDLFGYAKVELLKLKVQDFYANPDDYAKFQQRLETHGVVKDFETQYRKKNGQLITCLETATVRKGDDGAILSYQGIIRDITALKRAEQERLRLTAIERDLTLAQDIQQNLLPPPKPNWPELDVVCYSLPAREMGGDFYAYYAFGKVEDARQGDDRKGSSLSPGPNQSHFALVVGDVTDKGMPAALLMAVSLSSFRSIVGQALAAAELLAQLDEAIIDYTRSSRQNCALVYVGLDLTGSTMQVANAGCIAPIIKRSNGAVEWVDIGGLPLGVGLGRQFGYQETSLSISKGDIIVLTSDGVIEANNAAGQMFGFEQWEEVIKTGPTHSAAALLDHLKQAVLAFMGEAEQHDDITIVVAQI